MNDAFGSWFSGITDGEGCFFIELVKPNKHQNYVKYRGYFCLGLRADDVDVINFMKDELGFGKVYYRHHTKLGNPQFYYKVSTVEDCCKLIKVFDTFPLRSKKLKDYLVWREFIMYKKDNFGNYNKCKNYVDTLEAFYHKLKYGRYFTEKRED